MSDFETRWHETWLGMAQPTEGLVVSVPVLVDAQCMRTLPVEFQRKLLDLCPPVDGKKRKDGEPPRAIRNLRDFLSELLDLTPDLFDSGADLPEDLSLYVPEGRQTIRPTLALRRPEPALEPEEAGGPADASTPASRAGARYLLLAWDLPDGLPFDKPETVTGPWDYPPAHKFERLLRHVRVPIGLLTNRRVVRLVYAPHGESVGSITFRIDDMANPGGRPLLDAFVMLLSSVRLFGVDEGHRLPALLAESRKRQANVTKELAEQVLQAIEILLRGFEAAAERDGSKALDDALAEGDDHLYGGLLTVLLRLVFVLYAESRGLLPVENRFYAEHLSLYGLFDQLQEDHGAYPDSMSLRFGAWGRLLVLFRAIFRGVRHGDLHLPARRGQLFNPDDYPFLEGWPRGGSAPMDAAEDRAAVRVPSIDDATIYRVLEKLVVFQGQRLSYAALDVEQIGSVYEAVMGYHVQRVPSPAVCLRQKNARVWIVAQELIDQAPTHRAKWLQKEAGLEKAPATKLAEALKGVKSEEQALEILESHRSRGTERAPARRLVLQPGAERKRTSSHYTPRSLTEPIVRKTLEPLLATMGPEPPSALILSLRICDPAMGSGAFLVEACRFLADRLVAAWTREGRLELIAAAHEDVLNYAKRLVAQKCLYGVDKNRFAVALAKLSLWLETLAKELPFTFLDHALRHGDSLVGLSFEQIRGFHWKPEGQLDLASKPLDEALAEAIGLRQRIQELAEDASPEAQKEKEWLLRDAEDATKRVRLIGDLVVGAFFSSTKDRERKQELNRRWTLVNAWLEGGGAEPAELLELQEEIRGQLPVFHWMLEFPEVFYAERPDPLEKGIPSRTAWKDGFIGNPPFLGGRRIRSELGDVYSDWVEFRDDASKNADLAAHFFCTAERFLGSHGAFGLIASNTIAQGDTRDAGLKRFVDRGDVIYEVVRDLAWPGAANVIVSVIHVAKGYVSKSLREIRINGRIVPSINSRLLPKPERPDPRPLSANKEYSFNGSLLAGIGFVLSPQERECLIRCDAANEERIFPYLGGEEVNSRHSDFYERYVIDFGSMTLAEAGKWPDLLEIIRERVKPERDRSNRDAHRRLWWQYGDKRPALYSAIRPLSRCLVAARVTKHLCFSFQPTGIVFNEKLYVFPFDGYGHFALLQSRIHGVWAWLLSSTMKNDLNYSPTECFDTFPFPERDPRHLPELLVDVGERVYRNRLEYMRSFQQGLTGTYNRLVDPQVVDPRTQELRFLHEELDRAVLSAYNWVDIHVPLFTKPTTEAERSDLRDFEDKVIDRLFELNAQRAEEERRAALSLEQREGRGRKGGRGRGKKEGSQMTLEGVGDAE